MLFSWYSRGTGAWLSKTNICDAFKLFPIQPDQWPMFGSNWWVIVGRIAEGFSMTHVWIKLKGLYHFYHRLAFRCWSCPVKFDHLSATICWIAYNNYILDMLDDVLTDDPPDHMGERPKALLTTLFHHLKIPLPAYKYLLHWLCLNTRVSMGYCIDDKESTVQLW